MALVSELSPRAAKKLHKAGLLSDVAKQKIERRNKLAKRLWLLIALLFGLTVWGVTYVVDTVETGKSVPVQRAT